MRELASVVLCLLIVAWVWILQVRPTWRGDQKSSYVRNAEEEPGWYPFGYTYWRIQARSLVLGGALITLLAVTQIVDSIEGSATQLMRDVLIAGLAVIAVGILAVGLFARPKVLIPPPFRNEKGPLGNRRSH